MKKKLWWLYELFSTLIIHTWLWKTNFFSKKNLTCSRKKCLQKFMAKQMCWKCQGKIWYMPFQAINKILISKKFTIIYSFKFTTHQNFQTFVMYVNFKGNLTMFDWIILFKIHLNHNGNGYKYFLFRNSFKIFLE